MQQSKMINCENVTEFLLSFQEEFKRHNIDIIAYTPRVIYAIRVIRKRNGAEALKVSKKLADRLNAEGVSCVSDKPAGFALIGRHLFEFSVDASDDLSGHTDGSLRGKVCVDMIALLNQLTQGHVGLVESNALQSTFVGLYTEFEAAYQIMDKVLSVIEE